MQLSDRFSNIVGELISFIPQLIGALAILAIGYLIAKLVQLAVNKALKAAQFDQRLRMSEVGVLSERLTATPSSMLARVTFWALFVSSWAVAASVLQIAVLTDFIKGLYGFAPHLLAALLIIGVASISVAIFTGAIKRTLGETATGKIAATVVPMIVMTIAAFMALSELGVARDIVNITFTALIGAVALGSALAFGLGGRDVAAKMLDDAYAAGQKQAAQVRLDLAEAKERATVKSPQFAQEEELITESEPVEMPQWGAQPAFGERIEEPDNKSR